MTRWVELRSDTFTLPDADMRRAIHEAEVGNSAYAEDPSVRRLEEEIADWFGVEAGLFLPSATMAGQVAFKLHTRPGDVVLIEEFGHGYYFESGAMGLISGVVPRLLKGERGVLSAAQIAGGLEHLELAHGRAALAVIENTANFGGGTLYTPQELASIFELCKTQALPLHVDGARIWNAVVATGAAPGSLAPPPGNTLSVCFSKGLGAPMGALLLGDRDDLAQARRLQMMLGGTMRQVGFMAAAALHGFRYNLPRLAEDHANARLIADLISASPGVALEPTHVQTNILYFDVVEGADRATRLVHELEEAGIGAWNLGSLVRLVTSLSVTREDCEYAAEQILRRLG